MKFEQVYTFVVSQNKMSDECDVQKIFWIRAGFYTPRCNRKNIHLSTISFERVRDLTWQDDARFDGEDSQKHSHVKQWRRNYYETSTYAVLQYKEKQ